MRPDAEALRSLELPRVLELVARRAASEPGAEAVRRLLPMSSRSWIVEELAAVEEMAAFLVESRGWAPPRIPSLGPVLRKLEVEGSELSGEELVQVGVLLASCRKARSDLRREPDAFPLLAERAEGLLRHRELEETLERSLTESGAVTDAASTRLRKIRSDLRGHREALVERLEEIVRGLRDRIRVEDASVTVRNGRYCIPVRRDGRSEVGGIVHDESSTGHTLFVEPPEAVEPMNRVRELELEEKREERRIRRELTDEVRPLAGDLTRGHGILVGLDSLHARARYALEHGGEAPEVGPEEGDRGVYEVVQGRHPLLVADRDETAVPFDLHLSADERVLLVSGPNAGGKTVLLKTVGLLSAMAQSGVVPPAAAGTRLPLFRRFFTVIGDEQSIEASLSTFSARLEGLREILEEADGASLVLLDEMGSHTDPAEGGALSTAVLERLAGQAALTVATSHLGELKALAGEDDRIVNASLQFDRQRLRPTYRFRRDRPGRSYALEIAARLDLPEDVLERARARLGEAERGMESVLTELEEREERLSRLEAEVREAREELAERLGEMEERAAEVERRERELEREARERAERYLLEAREEVEEAIRRLEREYAGREPERRQAASEARSRVERTLRRTREAKPDAPEPAPTPVVPDLEEGDRVRIRSLGREGRVQEVRDDRVVVEAGSVRLTLPVADLDPVRDEEAGDGGRAGRSHGDGVSGEGRQDSAPGGGTTYPEVEARSEVHLRGLRVHEVESELLPLLDAAFVADLPRFRIVHGKGTGALRERVREILEEDPRVASFRHGERGEGGRGVTVVEFRRG